MSNEIITLNRDCDATLVPWGTDLFLPAGTEVVVVQALGGSHTVNVNGNLVRIAAKDADALGKESKPKQPEATELVGDGSVDEKALWQEMRSCYDPEIPVNIVDLGLIYKCEVSKLENGNRVDVDMTLTAPGCGMGPIIAEEVEYKLRSVQNVTDVHVEIVFDPPWDRSMMSQAAQLELGIF